MATHRWTGAADGVTLTTVGNWFNETAAATTTAFAAGDILFITSSTVDITAGLDFGSTNLEAVYISFNKNLGTSSTSASFNVSNAATSKLVYTGTGQFCNITARAAGAITLIQAFHAQGKLRISGGATVTNLEIGPTATVELDATGTVTNLYQGGGSIVAAAGTAFTIVDILAGTMLTSRSIATARVLGSNSAIFTIDTAAFTTNLLVSGGARVNHQSTGTITAGTIGSNSRIDAAGSLRTFTVTNFTRFVGAYFLDSESVAPTYTNAVVKRCYV